MWGMIASGIGSMGQQAIKDSAIVFDALSGASQAMSQAANEKFRLEQAAQTAKHQANLSKLAAGTTAYERGLAMRSLENQALAQGLSDGIAMSQTNVAQSTTGVALASKSKYMARASQRLMHVINQSNMEINRVTTLGNLEAKKVGLMGDALIHNANAKANTILADAINVSQAGQMAFLGSLMKSAQSFDFTSNLGSEVAKDSMKNSGGSSSGASSGKSGGVGLATK